VLAGVNGTHPFRLMPVFFGATSIERLPTERAITGQVKTFKGLPVG
jgi:predicted TIM-barrel enzyme